MKKKLFFENIKKNFFLEMLFFEKNIFLKKVWKKNFSPQAPKSPVG